MRDESLVHELTQTERYSYGTCPICDVSHGQFCIRNSEDNRYIQRYFAHLARLDKAPYKIEIEQRNQ